MNTRSIVARLHQDNRRIAARQLDDVLLIRPASVEARLELGELVRQFGVERLEYGDHPYSVIREIYRAIPRAWEVLDLGSGHGRVVLYGAVLGQRMVHGIEIVPDRALSTKYSIRQLELTNARVTIGNVARVRWPSQTRCFVLLNSFYDSTMRQVLKRLRKAATRKRIMVISISSANYVLERQRWLVDARAWSMPSDLRFFWSIPTAARQRP